MSKESLLLINNISVKHGNTNIIHDISLEVKPRQVITIIGPNGSGKTTLAKAIIGIIPISSGNIKRKSSLKIGYMPQKVMIDKNFPITVARFLSLHNNKPDQQLIEETLHITNLNKSLFKKQLMQLSGGELQRVMLTRALISKPELLILDEPLQGMDINGQLEFYNILNKVRNDCSIIMISHDLFMVMKNTDHVICLNHHICCQGSPEYVTTQDSYQKFFGHNLEHVIATYNHHHDHEH
jgi:zinc transport system ATP-binding protein